MKNAENNMAFLRGEFWSSSEATRTVNVKDDARLAVESEGKNVWYNGLLLAISFIFFFLGLLPPSKNNPVK